ATNISHPLLQKREVVKNSLLLVICSNRGLCGGYNGAIIREGMGRVRLGRQEKATPHPGLSRKRGIAYFRVQHIPREGPFTHFEDKPRFDEVDELANRYIAGYIAGTIDRVDVAYMKFLNAARQAAVVETLLPLSAEETAPRRPGEAAKVEYEFLP